MLSDFVAALLERGLKTSEAAPWHQHVDVARSLPLAVENRQEPTKYSVRRVDLVKHVEHDGEGAGVLLHLASLEEAPSRCALGRHGPAAMIRKYISP